MNDKMGLNEFFAMEAGDYLKRLDAMVSVAHPPAPEELVRLTRALRGSALMANQRSIAKAAAALEGLTRTYLEGRRPWDEAFKQLCISAVDRLEILVRGANQWSADLESKAEALTSELSQATGAEPATATPAKETGGDAGTRAFVAREGAAVASALKQAATAVAQEPGNNSALERLLAVMQPLRGVASLTDFPPIGELLDGCERVIEEIRRVGAATPGAVDAFNAGSLALARAAREVGASGTPEGDSPENVAFADALEAYLAGERLQVPVEALYPDGQDGMVERGSGPPRGKPIDPVELVAQGEHLGQLADEIRRSRSATQTRFKVPPLLDSFRLLAEVGGNALAAAVSRVARAAWVATHRGMVTAESGTFVEHLRNTAVALGTAVTEDPQTVASKLDESAQAFAGMAAATAAPEPVTATAAEPAAVGQEAVPAAPPVAAPSPARPVATPQPAPSQPQPTTATNLAGSWTEYERLKASGAVATDLDQLLGAAPSPTPAPAPAAAPRAPTAPAATEARPGTPAEELPTVPVTELCYTGTRALERALELKAEILASLSEPTSDQTKVTSLLEEVFDLIEAGNRG